MALANIIPFVRRTTEPESAGEQDMSAQALLERYLDEAHSQVRGWTWKVVPTDHAAGRAILDADPSLHTAVIADALARLVKLVEVRVHGGNVDALRALLPLLCRRRVPYSAADLRRILSLLAESHATWSTWVPLLTVVKSIERWVDENGLPPAIRLDLMRLQAAGQNAYLHADERKALAIVDTLLAVPAADADPFDPNDDWGYAARQAFAQLDAVDRGRWLDLLAYAATADGSKPSKPWLKRAAERLDAVGREASREIVTTCLGFVQAPARPPIDVRSLSAARVDIMGNVAPTAILTEGNGNLLKGLAWCCALFDDPAIASTVGNAAEALFKKIPNIGARSTKAGNAGLYALGAMPGLHGVAQLQRLLQRVKQPSAITQIETALAAAARREGMTRDDLDDLAVPTFDLVDGRRREAFGDYAAEIVVAGPQQIDVNWFGPDGKPRKSEPAEVKRQFPDEFKAFKRLVDDVRKTLPAQRDRIERILMSERAWSLTDWRQRYLDNPLLAIVARRLIWQFEEGDRLALGAWRDGTIVGADDQPLDWLTDESRVRLWHPISAAAATVESWQTWLERNGVTQPFKQAHREVYVLTDAERTTETYSNRFAGHILRQHQLQALCQQRGWTYRLQGAWDGANNPDLTLPAWNLNAEFWVEGAEDDDQPLSHAGIYLHVGTDQVRFTRTDQHWGPPVPLAEIPPVVFSEVMRDVDLFVAVCTLGNDPTWFDRGEDRFAGYWRGVAFGDLSASAKTRRVVLERLIPRLKIADRCTIADTFLVVRGDLRIYKIHLGSANILMEPNNQYLCIVPHRGAAAKDPAQGILLPFEGDGQLSVILSKAFLLANDTAIIDPTITRQIRR